MRLAFAAALSPSCILTCPRAAGHAFDAILIWPSATAPTASPPAVQVKGPTFPAGVEFAVEQTFVSPAPAAAAAATAPATPLPLIVFPHGGPQ